ncbi:hypothetical protein [Novispirillum itersonii]|uniref:Uncharacterized protein n=1 Tax=Novispirillum itersonii TaxID=189 RepID=A0A7W9ZD14_NOVIT|nr:hypothetical protein [Novispirillum itersonii]MBB6209181.1 hypothetical protein [Novispirillum itersonii]
MPLKRHESNVLKFLFQHLAVGTMGGLVFGILLLWTDIGSIRSMAMRSDSPALILILLFFGLFVTFGSVAMGIGIMSQGEDKN